jgi:protein-S-isoprenylcysteine O-methyltransferase Ste14
MNLVLRLCKAAVTAAIPLLLAPLVLWPARLSHPGPWIAFAVWTILILSNPPFPKVSQLVVDRVDRFSTIWIIASFQLALVVGALDFGQRSPGSRDRMLVFSGVLLASLGVWLRLWAIRTLGRFFTSTIKTSDDQDLVKLGPYARIRHPSYTGAIISIAGMSLLLGSWWMAALSALVVVPAYLYRIHYEEHALRQRFGERYLTYCREAGALFPHLARETS